MSPITTAQSAFAASLLDGARAAPEGLVDPQGQPAGKRFDVYRNNVAVGLTEALETAFPVVRKLVGDTFFKAMAGVFLREHPPKSPILMLYGDEMPAFVDLFEPSSHLGYLPDIARLELALRQSYHAPDSTAIDPAALQALPVEDLMRMRLRLAPALRVLRSSWPIHAIWRANTIKGAPVPEMRPEDVLITRPDLDAQLARLPCGGAVLLQHLMAGNSFGHALAAAGNGAPDPDLAILFGQLIAGAGIVDILDEEPS